MIKKINKSGTISIKRKLESIEKILIIYLSFTCLPLGLSISSFILTEVNPLSAEVFVPIIPAWFLITFSLSSVELGLKNSSLYNGLIKSTILSTLFSFGLVFAIMCLYFIDGYYYKTYLAFSSFIAGFYDLFLFLTRVIIHILNKLNKKVCLLIGPKEDTITLARKLMRENKKQYRVKYLFFEENLDEEKLYEKIKRCNTIILLNTLTFKNKQKFLSYFNSTIDKEVYLCTTYFDIVLLGNNVKSINDVLSYEQKPLKIEFVERILKRTIDILCSLLILLVSLPVWLFVPIIIKAQDGGPVFYKQVRLTKGMKEFNILKFRSMRVDAEKNGAQLATANDSRVTKFGKFIRATRIDEIPQVLNVLKGDMSLVGPRPERPEFVSKFIQENDQYIYRYNVKAGVTGLQQVKTTYHTTYDDKLRYDLYYISNYTIVLDIEILFLTIKTVLSKSMAEGVDTTNASFEEFVEKEGFKITNHESYYHIGILKS